MAATGLCHSDKRLQTGDMSTTHYPLIAGHEGAGTVEAITKETAEQWLKAAPARPGSRWPHSAQWLASRGGGEKDAPHALGGLTLPPRLSDG